MTSSTRWRKSSYSGGENNACVEIDRRAEVTGIRDSKVPNGDSLTVSTATWVAFTGGLLRGAYEQP
ncbi:DUF397 domain-containing protein [Haloechinothrix sp. YIM 98757]|uniref:DUF397 domain-containing protein n=1 Tax=Haloechinothrix aidingensis TaxID=2752311 RepID=A0A838ABU1_9PSEU|nr:DUF397 domain-containing protein [Haloechinothrix aidingensis]MBA0126706.1 DUF397 domain-containing protein [Haloechinothrix aidingensis]